MTKQSLHSYPSPILCNVCADLPTACINPNWSVHALTTARPIAYLLLPGTATTVGGDSCVRRGKHLTTAELVLNKPRKIEKVTLKNESEGRPRSK